MEERKIRISMKMLTLNEDLFAEDKLMKKFSKIWTGFINRLEKNVEVYEHRRKVLLDRPIPSPEHGNIEIQRHTRRMERDAARVYEGKLKMLHEQLELAHKLNHYDRIVCVREREFVLQNKMKKEFWIFWDNGPVVFNGKKLTCGYPDEFSEDTVHELGKIMENGKEICCGV